MTAEAHGSAVQTVLGPVHPSHLGAVAMHEHLASGGAESEVWVREGSTPAPEDPDVSLGNLGLLRWNVGAIPGNLRLDEEDTAAAELAEFAAVGGGTLVELSTIGSRDPAALVRISRAAGVHVVMGTAYYVGASHPPELFTQSSDQIAERFIRDLTSGIDDTGVRAGIIGEVGTSDPLTPSELKVLEAAAQASIETGVSISIHLEPTGTAGVTVAETLLDYGLSPERIVLGHLDGNPDVGYQAAVAATGCGIQYDAWGMEVGWDPFALERTPSDAQRIRLLDWALAHNLLGRLTLSSDVCMKTMWRRYGGYGYGHLLGRVLPALVSHHGMTADEVRQMTVDNPRRVLTPVQG